MYRRLSILLVCCLLAIKTIGQVKGIVIDAETSMPIKGVNIIINGSYVNTLETDYRGSFFIPNAVNQLHFSCFGYERRIMTREELTDTILLLPSAVRLNEVIVYGKYTNKGTTMTEQLRKELGSLPNTKSGISFDLFSLFERNHVSARKRKERMDAIKNY